MELKEAISLVEKAIQRTSQSNETYDALSVLIARAEEPQDAILFCPECKEQHVDKAEPDVCESCGHNEEDHPNGGECGTDCQCAGFVAWLNPPHKKHRCHNCNHVWKPLSIPTNGVKSLQATTEGK